MASTIETELHMLRAARASASAAPVRIVTSYLGAHATAGRICRPTRRLYRRRRAARLRAAHAEGLVDAVDGFCEGIAFYTDEIARVFDCAAELGLPVKLHAEQLSHMGGTQLATRYGALSADHLEFIDEADAAAMAAAGTVAVMLPGAFYCDPRDARSRDIAALRRHGVPMAVATDCNPGTSPLTSLLLAMNMAATLFGLTVDECLAGVNAKGRPRARALDETGTLEAGKSADLAIWNVETPAELVYRIGFNPLHTRFFKGTTL